MSNSVSDIIIRRATGMTRKQVQEATEEARHNVRQASKYTQNADDEKAAEHAHKIHQEWQRIATAMDDHTMTTYNPENDPTTQPLTTQTRDQPTPPPLRPEAGPAMDPTTARRHHIIQTALGRTGLAYEMSEADHLAAQQLLVMDDQLLHRLADWLERARKRGLADGAAAQAVRDANQPRRRTIPRQAGDQVALGSRRPRREPRNHHQRITPKLRGEKTDTGQIFDHATRRNAVQ
ncbi:hypothetical protein AB0O82_32540 [Kitasatospora sp. NPDC088264]|uniref:hypothetical protein n=1 Tax=Kitasatospora sp. NPDC088264 TaxID=3155296 RepID=UPI00341B2B4E